MTVLAFLNVPIFALCMCVNYVQILLMSFSFRHFPTFFQDYTGVLKMQDLKLKDQVSGHENAGPENEGLSRNVASLCN